MEVELAKMCETTEYEKYVNEPVFVSLGVKVNSISKMNKFLC